MVSAKYHAIFMTYIFHHVVWDVIDSYKLIRAKTCTLHETSLDSLNYANVLDSRLWKNGT